MGKFHKNVKILLAAVWILISFANASLAFADECRIYKTPKDHNEEFQVIVFRGIDGSLTAGIYNGKDTIESPTYMPTEFNNAYAIINGNRWEAGCNSKWSEYWNGRFGFVIDVPPNFNEHTPPTNGDGQTWTSQDGQSRLSAYGNFDFPERESNYETERKRAKADKENTYFAEGKGWFVTSGKRESEIYYNKSMLSEKCADNVIISFHILYPANQKKKLDKIVTRIQNSFKSTRCLYSEN